VGHHEVYVRRILTRREFLLCRAFRERRLLTSCFWRCWGTYSAAKAKKGASGYQTQAVVGIMQALVDKKVVEHKSVVLWSPPPGVEVCAFDQGRLEMFFGAMVFIQNVLDWAAYGLYEEQERHALSDKEVADKKQLYIAYNKSAAGIERTRRFLTTKKGKARQRGNGTGCARYRATPKGKASRKRGRENAGASEETGNKRRARVLQERHKKMSLLTARRQSGCRCSTCGSAGGLRCGGRKRRSSLVG
jgi:hypothetical protein